VSAGPRKSPTAAAQGASDPEKALQDAITAGASRLEALLLSRILDARLPMPAREVRFAPPRRWRLDFVWGRGRCEIRGCPVHPAQPLAVEVEGGTYSRSPGRHSRGKGFESDCEKYAEALIRGYRVLRVTGAMVEDGRAITLIRRALAWTP